MEYEETSDGHDGSRRSPACQIDQVCDRFDEDWRNGLRPRTEAYLGEAAPFQRSALLRELLTLEIESRVALGESVPREEILGRFPEDSTLVQSVFEALQGRCRAAVDQEPRSASEVPTEPAMTTPNLGPAPNRTDSQPNVASAVAEPRGFGDYEIFQEIGRGGMGVVYRARQVKLNRMVALKMILSGQLAGPEEVRRFYAEARAAANLDHPNIITIHEVGEHEGQHYFSMKLVDGGNLSGRVSSLVDEPLAAVVLMEQISRAVNHAHESGLLHRDLKPSNILIDGKGVPYITDFGLVKRIGSESLTQSGQLLGTPNYMSPEQAGCRKELVCEASDVYALGAMLYELLTGKPPFLSKTPLETLRLVENSSPKRPRMLNPAVDPALESITLKCLEKDPRKRYETAGRLADDLQVWLKSAPSRRNSLPLARHLTRQGPRRLPTASRAAAIALVAIVALAGFAMIVSGRLPRGIDPAASGVPSSVTGLMPPTAPSRTAPAAPAGGQDSTLDGAAAPINHTAHRADSTHPSVPEFDPPDPPIAVAAVAAVFPPESSQTHAVAPDTSPAASVPATGSPTTVPADTEGVQSVETVLSELRRQGKAPIAEELKRRIDRAREKIKVAAQFRPDHGSIIVGQVVAEGLDDPRGISAQMNILEGGYFASEVAAPGGPVGFCMSGYQSVSVIPSGRPGTIQYVGQVRLKPVPIDRQATLEGVIQLEGKDRIEGGALFADVDVGPDQINSISGGTEPFDPTHRRPLRLALPPNGRFLLNGLSPSPTSYWLHVSAPGFVSFSERVQLRPGKTTDLGTITLETPRSIDLAYLVEHQLPFKGGGPRKKTLLVGEPWIASPVPYGSDLEFDQYRGKVSFKVSYTPCGMADLGNGEIDMFYNVDPAKLNLVTPESLRPETGHVYLLNQGHFQHWVLFKVLKIE